jgi:type VI secretion system secreted protein Hcp
MAEDSRDILMKMVPSNSVMPAECQAMISTKDTLAIASNFAMITKSGRGSPSPNYFSIDDFTFEVGLQDKKGQAAKDNAGALKELQKQNEARNEALLKLHPDLKGIMGGGGGGSSSKFKRFILEGSNGLGTGVNKTFVGDLSEITITKRMDVSSPALLTYCLNREQFKSATLVKRKATGANELQSYFKIEFNQLMITSFDWADDDVVKETFKFVCRQAIVTYAVEDNSGALYTQPTAKWEVAKFTPS